MRKVTQQETDFLGIVEHHRGVITRVCYMYASDRDHFNDLYQETLANLWQGVGKFRGDSNIATWIYRVTINTCITYYRSNRRHNETESLDSLYDIAEEVSTRTSDIKEMYKMISRLRKLDRAIILLWLDEKSYDEIAEITGLSRNNVASRLRRIKEHLAKEAEK